MCAKKNDTKKTQRGGLQLERVPKNESVSDGAPLAVGGFHDAGTVEIPKGAIIKTMSPMLKPAQWPKDANGRNRTLVGVFRSIFETKPGTAEDGSQKLGEGVEIVPEGAPVGVALPVTATLKTGLEITGSGKAASSPHLGCVVAVELMAEKIPSKKGNAAWHFVVAIYPRVA